LIISLFYRGILNIRGYLTEILLEALLQMKYLSIVSVSRNTSCEEKYSHQKHPLSYMRLWPLVHFLRGNDDIQYILVSWYFSITVLCNHWWWWLLLYWWYRMILPRSHWCSLPTWLCLIWYWCICGRYLSRLDPDDVGNSLYTILVFWQGWCSDTFSVICLILFWKHCLFSITLTWLTILSVILQYRLTCSTLIRCSLICSL